MKPLLPILALLVACSGPLAKDDTIRSVSQVERSEAVTAPLVTVVQVGEILQELGFLDMRHGSLQRIDRMAMYADSLYAITKRAGVTLPDSVTNGWPMWATGQEVFGRQPLIGYEGPDSTLVPVSLAAWVFETMALMMYWR